MTGVDYVNQLSGDEKLKSLQRINSRFVNAGIIRQFLSPVPEGIAPLLKRMMLDLPTSMKERVLQSVVAYAMGNRH